MVIINKYLTAYPLYFTRLFPLALLLCVTACGGKKDLASQPLTITPSERIVPSSAPNEPPIIILSPASGDTGYTPTKATTPRKTKRKISASPVSNYTKNTVIANQGSYAVQIGAFSSNTIANSAASQARQGSSFLLSSAQTHIDTIPKNGKSLYRVKLTGINQDTASQACSELKQKQIPCIVTR